MGSDGYGQVLGPGQGGAQALQVLWEVGVGMGGQLDDRHVNASRDKVFGGLTAEGVGDPAPEVGVLRGAGDGAGEFNGAAAGTRHDHAAPAVEEDGGDERTVKQVAGQGAGLGLREGPRAACAGDEPGGSEGVALPAGVPIAVEVDAVGVFARAGRGAVGVEIGNEGEADAVGDLGEVVAEVVEQEIGEDGGIGFVALVDAADDGEPARAGAQLDAADGARLDGVAE